MTLDELLAAFNNRFDSADDLAVALQLLDARMDIELANGAARLAQAQATAANQQAQATIQQMQAQAHDAEERFDQIVATLVGEQ